MLHTNKIDPKRIHVYVANQEEYEKYKVSLNASMYHRLEIGVLGLVPQREWICQQFPEGKPIVFMDDDIASVDLSLMAHPVSLHVFLQQAFKTTASLHASIWSVYPVFNPYFRKERKEVTTGLAYMIGAFYGIFHRKNKNLRVTLCAKTGQKEDVERTLRYFIEDGLVVRFNRVGFVTKYYGKEGGLGTFEARLKPMLEASRELKKHFPDYGDIITRPNGMTEFRLKRIAATTTRTTRTTRTRTTRTRRTRTRRTTRTKMTRTTRNM
jgi:hypothetical protein